MCLLVWPEYHDVAEGMPALQELLERETGKIRIEVMHEVLETYGVSYLSRAMLDALRPLHGSHCAQFALRLWTMTHIL